MTRRAATLAELLLAVAVLGILAGLAAPRIAAAADRAALRSARAELLRALDAARGTAVRVGSIVELRDDGGMLELRRGGDRLWRGPAPATFDVALSGLATGVAFGPSGIAVGVANRTLRLSRGRDTLAVVLSRLGRIR